MQKLIKHIYVRSRVMIGIKLLRTVTNLYLYITNDSKLLGLVRSGYSQSSRRFFSSSCTIYTRIFISTPKALSPSV